MADPFWSLLAPILAPVPLIMADQNAPRPAKPYATLDVTNAGAARWLTELPPDAAGNARFVEHRLANVEVQFYGADAQDRASDLGMRLRLPRHVNRAVDLGLGVAVVNGATSVAVLMNENQYEQRGILEFTCHVGVEITDEVGLIEHTETEGEYDGVGGACQHVISAPGATPPP